MEPPLDPPENHDCTEEGHVWYVSSRVRAGTTYKCRHCDADDFDTNDYDND